MAGPRGAPIAGTPVTIAYPNYLIGYSFINAPDVLTWCAPNGLEAEIAPFIRRPGAAIWSRAPQTIFNYVETLLVNPSIPYRFVLHVRGLITVDTTRFPVYATDATDIVNVEFKCGQIGAGTVEAARQNIQAGIANYRFEDDIDLSWRGSGQGSYPGVYTLSLIHI